MQHLTALCKFLRACLWPFNSCLCAVLPLPTISTLHAVCRRYFVPVYFFQICAFATNAFCAFASLACAYLVAIDPLERFLAMAVANSQQLRLLPNEEILRLFQPHQRVFDSLSFVLRKRRLAVAVGIGKQLCAELALGFDDNMQHRFPVSIRGRQRITAVRQQIRGNGEQSQMRSQMQRCPATDGVGLDVASDLNATHVDLGVDSSAVVNQALGRLGVAP